MSECVEWTGAKNNAGYGVRRIAGKNYLVHRLSFAEHNDRQPVGLVRHTCDNRSCYNPDHLIEGTFQQNSQDMIDRDRSNKGERHPLHKLSADQIDEIMENAKTRAVTQRSLAHKFGVAETTISGIVRGRSWKHVR